MERLPNELLSGVDALTPNETELQTLTGGSGNEIEEHAELLLVTERQTAVVTIGAKDKGFTSARCGDWSKT